MSEDGSYPGLGYLVQFLTGQHVLSAPSVFNFYSPNYSQPGELDDLGWVSPELQITTEDTIVGITNLVAATIYQESGLDTPADFPKVTFDLSHYLSLLRMRRHSSMRYPSSLLRARAMWRSQLSKMQ